MCIAGPECFLRKCYAVISMSEGEVARLMGGSLDNTLRAGDGRAEPRWRAAVALGRGKYECIVFAARGVKRTAGALLDRGDIAASAFGDGFAHALTGLSNKVFVYPPGGEFAREDEFVSRYMPGYPRFPPRS